MFAPLLFALFAAADPKPVEIDGLKSTPPADWVAEEPQGPSKSMRQAQFKLPKADGADDAEVIVFFFNKGVGGNVEQNLARWKDTFKTDAEPKVEEFKVGDVKVTRQDISGTYKFRNPPFAPNAKTEEKANYKQSGVVWESPNGPYFIVMRGPAKTVEKHDKAFTEWLKNFK